MHKNKFIIIVGLAAIFIVSGLLFTFDTALAVPDPLSGDCVQDFQPGAVCTANDVRIEELTVIEVHNECYDYPDGTFTADFDVLISAGGSPDRYDIGFYIATDGGSAMLDEVTAGGTNSCFHSYLGPDLNLDPAYGNHYYNDELLPEDQLPDIYDGVGVVPFDGWWNSDLDACGDMETNTQAIHFVTELTVSCEDPDGDGYVDISVCTSWDNNEGTVCTGVDEAFPGTKSKCSCDTITLWVPTAVTLSGLSASSSTSTGWLIPLIAVVLFAGSAGVLLLVKKFTPQEV